MNEEKNILLSQGYDEEEGCLIGTDEGLKNLIISCQTALEKGDCRTEDLGDFYGIVKVKEDYFDTGESNLKILTRVFMIPIAILSVLVVFFIGATTVFKWIFN
jgi:hypothetical protein